MGNSAGVSDEINRGDYPYEIGDHAPAVSWRGAFPGYIALMVATRAARIGVLIGILVGCAGGGSGGSDQARGGADGGSGGRGGTGAVAGSSPAPPSFDVVAGLPEHIDIAQQVAQPGAVRANLVYVSPDGSVAIGVSRLGVPTLEAAEVFRWTRSGGSTLLGRLNAGMKVGWELSSFTGSSGDASVVVGTALGPAGESIGFRWTEATGMVPIPAPDGAAKPYATVSSVSEDGSTLGVGIARLAGNHDPYVWTEGSGLTPILAPAGLDGSAALHQLNAKGSAAFGTGFLFDPATGADVTQAFRWTAASGSTGLGILGGHATCEHQFLQAYPFMGYAALWNGDVALGRCRLPGGGSSAFLWTETSGLIGLGSIAGFQDYKPTSVSADGEIVVGIAESSADATQGFRWERGTLTGLGYLPGETDCTPLAGRDGVSRDGSVIGGLCVRPSTFAFSAFVWSTGSGMRQLRPVGGLPETFCSGVSPDGKIVAGSSVRFDGTDVEASIATVWNVQGEPTQVDRALEAAGIDLGGVALEGVDAAFDARLIAGSGRDPSGRAVGWIARLP